MKKNLTPKRIDLIKEVARTLVFLYPKHGPESHDFGSIGKLSITLSRFAGYPISAKTLGRILCHDLKLPTKERHAHISYLTVKIKDLRRVKAKWLRVSKAERKIMVALGIEEPVIASSIDRYSNMSYQEVIRMVSTKKKPHHPK